MTPKHVSFYLAAIGIAALYSGRDGPIHQVNRVLAASADAVEHSSELLVAALDTTTNLTYTFSSMAIDAATVGKLAAAEFWTGVDLNDLELQRHEGTVKFAYYGMFAKWAHSDLAPSVLNITPQAIEVILSVAESLHVGMPALSSERILYRSSYRYEAVQATGNYLENGYFNLEWKVMEASYNITWANPIWEAAGFDPRQEILQVTSKIQEFFSKMPAPARPHNASDAIILLPPYWTRIIFVVKRWLRVFAHLLFD